MCGDSILRRTGCGTTPPLALRIGQLRVNAAAIKFTVDGMNTGPWRHVTVKAFLFAAGPRFPA
jgi:hypothetical protein